MTTDVTMITITDAKVIARVRGDAKGKTAVLLAGTYSLPLFSTFDSLRLLFFLPEMENFAVRTRKAVLMPALNLYN